MVEVGRVGTLQRIEAIPEDLKRIFITSFDVPPEIHLRIQAAFQEHTDNSVSKTINLPADSTVEDVRSIYTLAHELKCKGITIYRYGTKKGQVLSFDSRSEGEREEDLNFIMAESEYSGGCHSGLCPF
jgi:ribonucleoside-diphosphate reductase alpha chain